MGNLNPKLNFLMQFGGPKPEPTMWCVECSTHEGLIVIYVAPTWMDAIGLATKLRVKHLGAKIRITGDALVNN